MLERNNIIQYSVDSHSAILKKKNRVKCMCLRCNVEYDDVIFMCVVMVTTVRFSEKGENVGIKMCKSRKGWKKKVMGPVFIAFSLSQHSTFHTQPVQLLLSLSPFSLLFSLSLLLSHAVCTCCFLRVWLDIKMHIMYFCLSTHVSLNYYYHYHHYICICINEYVVFAHCYMYIHS